MQSILGDDFCNSDEDGRLPLKRFTYEKACPIVGDKENTHTRECIETFLRKGFYGLGSVWRTSPQFRAVQFKDNVRKKKGYWKFDGPTNDCEGQYVEVESVENDQTMREICKTKWEAELNAVTSRGIDDTNEEDEEVGDPNKTTDEEDESNDPQSNESGSKPSKKHGRHAMVLLGSMKDEQGKTLFVLLNSWPGMPLAVVSYDYMVACMCDLCFIRRDLPQDFLQGPPKTCGLLSAACSHPDFEDECYVDDTIVES